MLHGDGVFSWGGEEDGDEGENEGNVTFFSEERNKEPVLWMEKLLE